jgi:hypothetical protein
MSFWRALVSFASMFLALQAVTAEALTGHIQAVVPSTLSITEAVTVNLANGNITVCAAWGSGGVTLPTDDFQMGDISGPDDSAVISDRQACRRIGWISVAGVTRPTQIQITIPNQDVATIINLVKGQMTACSLSLDVNGCRCSRFPSFQMSP